jgi:hypothetical protein
MHARGEWLEPRAQRRHAHLLVGRTNRWCIEGEAEALHINDIRLHLWHGLGGRRN